MSAVAAVSAIVMFGLSFGALAIGFGPAPPDRLEGVKLIENLRRDTISLSRLRIGGVERVRAVCWNRPLRIVGTGHTTGTLIALTNGRTYVSRGGATRLAVGLGVPRREARTEIALAACPRVLEQRLASELARSSGLRRALVRFRGRRVYAYRVGRHLRQVLYVDPASLRPLALTTAVAGGRSLTTSLLRVPDQTLRRKLRGRLRDAVEALGNPYA
jgi:hypothetical protein